MQNKSYVNTFICTCMHVCSWPEQQVIQQYIHSVLHVIIIISKTFQSANPLIHCIFLNEIISFSLKHHDFLCCNMDWYMLKSISRISCGYLLLNPYRTYNWSICLTCSKRVWINKDRDRIMIDHCMIAIYYWYIHNIM